MEDQVYIAIEEICRHNSVSETFIFSLNDYDLIEISIINEIKCIPHNQLKTLEKFMRLHNDLEINSEGLGAIQHLTQRLEEMQQEINVLKKRLEIYEDEED